MSDEELAERVRVNERAVTANAKLISFDQNKLVRADLGDLNFSHLRRPFQRLCEVLSRLSADTFELLPRQHIDNLSAALDGMVSFLERDLPAFTLSTTVQQGSNLRQMRDQLAQKFESHHYTIVVQALPLASYAGSGVAVLSEAAQTVHAEQKKLESLRESAETVLQSLRDQAAKTGAEKYALTFKNQADGFRRASWWWLGTVVASASGLAGFGAWLVRAPHIDVSPGATTGLIVTQIAGRAAIFSALAYFLSWTARNYRAAKHNEITNRHREVALRTLEVIRDAAGDIDTKNAVLLRTADAIFQHQGTGFQTGDAEPGPPTSTIVEVLRRSGTDRQQG